MSEKREQILRMLAENKISVVEAEELLDAVGSGGSESSSAGNDRATGAGEPKYLRITVKPKRGDKDVNLRIPLVLVRAGAKLGGMLPDEAKGKINDALQAKGINLDINRADGEELAEVFRSLQDLKIEVDDDDEQVRIFTE